VGFTRGVHRWKISIDALRWWVAIGVHPKPRVGGGDSRETGYGAVSTGYVCYGPPRGCEGSDGNAISIEQGAVVSVELNCDAHTLTLTNPASTSGHASVCVAIPPGIPLFPWACLYGGYDQPTTITLHPF